MLCLQHFRTWILQDQVLLAKPRTSLTVSHSWFPTQGTTNALKHRSLKTEMWPTLSTHWPGPRKMMKDTIPPWCCDPQLCVQTSASQIWGSWESEDVSSDSVGLEEDLKHCLSNKLPGAIASPRTAQWGARWSDLEGPLKASFSVLFKLGSWELLMMYFGGMIWKTRRKPRTPLHPRINQNDSASVL